MMKLQWLPEPSDTQLVHERLTAMVEREHAATVDTTELKTIYLFLTRKCNLSCQHCYVEGVGPQAKGVDFSYETVRGIIEQARPHGLRKVKVSGGEPTVHKDFLPIMKYLGSIGLREIVLETNGLTLTPELISELEQIGGLTIFVSLDHADPAQHDAFRAKEGVFRRTARALQSLGASPIDSVVTTTANRYNYLHVREIASLVFGWGIRRHRTLLNIHPMGNARSFRDNALTLEECARLVSDLLSSPHFQQGRAYMTLPPALMPLEHLHGVHTCGWGGNVLGVLSNGDISMCSASYDDPNMIGGNVLQQDLMDIWSKSTFFEELRHIAHGDVKGVCSNCIFYKVCRGVCKMSSYAHYGEKDAPYPLCQEIYNQGAFPRYALKDPGLDCTYKKGTIPQTRAITEPSPGRPSP
jgi:radical SAM protein with 4Fe4S-binding SPASM domain